MPFGDDNQKGKSESTSAGVRNRAGAFVGPAIRWDVDHLFGEDATAGGPGAEGGPVAVAGDEGMTVGDDLVVHDLHAAGEVAVGLEDGAVGVMRGERAVGGVVEGAVVALRILIFELKQAFLAGGAVGDGVAC